MLNSLTNNINEPLETCSQEPYGHHHGYAHTGDDAPPPSPYYHQQHRQPHSYSPPSHEPPVYHPSAYAPTAAEEGPEGRQIPDLADHTTYKPFAYEAPPLPPLSGHSAVDRTIEEIHMAFIEGDPQSFEQGLERRGRS